jgi:hypothetical protein
MKTIRYSNGTEVAAKPCVACKTLIAATSFRCENCESNQPRTETPASSSLTNRGASILGALSAKIAAERRAAELVAAPVEVEDRITWEDDPSADQRGEDDIARDAKADADYDDIRENGDDRNF